MTGIPARRRDRRVGTTFLLTFALTAWSAAPAGAAPGGIQILREDLVLNVSPAAGITICPGETRTVTATLETEITYRNPNDPASVLRTMTRPAGLAGVVRAVSDGPGVATISPQFNPAIPPGGAARFTVVGVNPGRTNLRLSETQNASYRAQTIGVAVDDCMYLVSLRSNWNDPGGFQPDMTSILVGTLLTPTGTPGQFKGTGQLQNIAIPVPIGGCVPNFRAENSEVRITGTVDDDILTLEIDYLPIAVSATVVCLLVGGGNAHVSRVQNLTERVPADHDSVTMKWGHILTARVALPGKTEIRVEVIRIPS